MKLNLLRKDLVEALAAVRGAANGKTTLPILAHVAIVAKQTSVEFTATDLDLTVRTRIDAEVTEPGETTVNLRLLHELVKSFTDETVKLTLTKTQGLKVDAAQADYKIPTLHLEEFPAYPRIEDGVDFKLTQGQLRDVLHLTAFATSTDQSRYVLNGSFFELNGDLRCVATDGRRLAMAVTDLEGKGGKKTEVIIPARAVAELQRLLNGADERRVTITAGSNAVRFELGTSVVTCKLIEGTFPNYRQVIPKVGRMDGVLLSRAFLQAALHRIALFGEDCKLDFAGTILTVSSRNPQVGDAVETIFIPKSPRLTILFRVKYLMDALNAVSGDDILFHAEDSKSPGLMRLPEGEWTYVVMPLSDIQKIEKAEAKAAEEASKQPAATEETPATEPAAKK